MAPWTDPFFPWPGRALWRPLWPLAWLLAKAGWGLEVQGAHRVPSQGGLVVAANHLSHLDPPLLAVALRRPVRFLALDQLFGRNPVYDGVMLGFGAIPIPREGRAPLRALRTALGHLALGGVVGVFPEGRRVGSWGETEPRQGAAWLALRSDVPLLPVAISGTERSLGLGATRVRPAKVRMVLAEPMKPADYRRAPHPRAAMMDAWRARIDEHLVW